MTLTYENFSEQLANLDPETVDLYEQHLNEQGGLLGHVFLADWSRWIIAKYIADKEFHMNPAAAKLIEEGFYSEQKNKSETETLRNMVRLFVFENLLHEEELKPRMFADLGDGIKAVFEGRHSISDT